MVKQRVSMEPTSVEMMMLQRHRTFPVRPLLIIIREAGRGLLLLEEMKARQCLFLSISTWNLSSGTSFRRHAFQSIFSYLGVGEGLETW